jgi:hypothetical protein
MTISPSIPASFPPVDDAIRLIRTISVKRALHNFMRAGHVVTNCLIWTVALAVVSARLIRQAAPHIAALLRTVSDHLDPQPMTTRDVPDTLEFFRAQSIDRMVKPKVKPNVDLSIDADLREMNKPQLMSLYGTKSRRMTKETLIHKIMQRRLTNLEEGA